MGQIAYANNGGQPGPQILNVDLPAGFLNPNSCPFPIRVDGYGKTKTITLPGNRFIYTSPAFSVTVTNLDNPSKTVELNVTGAFHNTTRQNGDQVSVVTCRNLMGDPDAGLVVAIGTFSYIFDATGNLIQPLTGKGQLINVCDLIS